jgi:hypothetical protein
MSWPRAKRLELRSTGPPRIILSREAFLVRAVELERPILDTPAQSSTAIRAQTYALRRRMEMTQADELPVLREIETFVGGFAADVTR